MHDNIIPIIKLNKKGIGQLYIDVTIKSPNVYIKYASRNKFFNLTLQRYI